MNIQAQFVVLLTAGTIMLPAVISATEAAGRTSPVTVSATAKEAWEGLQSADAQIDQLLRVNRLSEVPAQAELIKTAVRTIGRGVHATDETISKRFNSAAREILVLADRLSTVAVTGNRTRAQTVYVNLHRYVEFAQTHLPSETGGNSRHKEP